MPPSSRRRRKQPTAKGDPTQAATPTTAVAPKSTEMPALAPAAPPTAHYAPKSHISGIILADWARLLVGTSCCTATACVCMASRRRLSRSAAAALTLMFAGVSLLALTRSQRLRRSSRGRAFGTAVPPCALLEVLSTDAIRLVASTLRAGGAPRAFEADGPAPARAAEGHAPSDSSHGWLGVIALASTCLELRALLSSEVHALRDVVQRKERRALERRLRLEPSDLRSSLLRGSNRATAHSRARFVQAVTAWPRPRLGSSRVGALWFLLRAPLAHSVPR